MFRVREPTSSSASKLLFLVLLSLLLRSCYCPLYFTHHLYLPFKLSLVCMLVPRALWGPLYFQALIPLLALKWKQLQPPPVSSPHLNSKVIHSLSSFKAKVVISLCRLIPSNGKRKIYLADQYSCTPIITAKLISRIFFDKKKAVKSLLTRKGALCHPKLKEKKKVWLFIAFSEYNETLNTALFCRITVRTNTRIYPSVPSLPTGLK